MTLLTTDTRSDTQRAVADAELLTTTVAQLSTAESLEAITGIVASAVRRLMNADGATFVLRDDGKCFYVDEDAIGPMWKGLRFPLEACISGWSMLNKQVVIIPDIYLDDRIPHDAYRPTFVKSLTMAPIRKDDPIGALGSYWADSRVPSDEDVRLLEVLANSAAVALENLELRGAIQKRSSERDSLAMRTDELEAAIHTLAHDLRSPLGAMLGYAELLHDGADPETAKVFSATIVDAGQRMAEQIDRMLGLYRVTSTTLNTEPVDLSALADKIAAGLTIGEAGERISITVADNLLAVADPVLAHLLLENLMSNAVKYSGKVEHAHIEVGTTGEQHGDLSEFFVRDNGAGFDSDSAALLFRPLTRLHDESEFKGTGLGLASVARIVENHGGTVRAEGAVDKGACFYFTLPSRPARVAAGTS